MSQRAVCRARRHSVRLVWAARSCAERLESRVLLSTYTVTTVNNVGPGSLRDAITNSSADMIVFGVTGTIRLETQLQISRNVTISGPGAAALAVSGENLTRIFQIDPGVVVEIDGLTITAGHAPDGVNAAAAGDGGAGASGGAILNAGQLTLANDTIGGSVAGTGGTGAATPTSSPGNGGPGGNGGAIYNSGALVLNHDALTVDRAGAGGTGSDSTGSTSPAGNGGQGGNGGAIYNDAAGTLVLTDDTFTSNLAGTGGAMGRPTAPVPTFGGAGGSGGAIYNLGTITMTGGSVSGNRAGAGANGTIGASGDGYPGAAGGGGGGIFSSGTLHLARVTVHGNTAGGGGGGASGATFGLFGGFAAPGAPGGSGGGIDSAGPLTIDACLFWGNVGGAGGWGGSGGTHNGGASGAPGGDGGGLYCGGAPTVLITDSTFTANAGGAGGGGGAAGSPLAGTGGPGGNGSNGGSGGGIFCANGILTLTNDTLVDNLPSAGGAAGAGAGMYIPPGHPGASGDGAGVHVGSPVTLYNTICDQIQGRLTGGSYNLVDAGAPGGLTNGANGNIVTADDFKLGPLASNGGPTQTLALLAGSPAIDHGSNSLASAAGLTTDQRGFGRIYNRIVDIGAFEFGSALPGDVNHDGAVNFADLLALAQNYGATNATWEQGDLDGDGSVNFADLLILAQNYGKRTGAVPVAAASSLPDVAPRRREVRF